MNGGSTSKRTPPHRQLPRMLLLIHNSTLNPQFLNNSQTPSFSTTQLSPRIRRAFRFGRDEMSEIELGNRTRTSRSTHFRLLRDANVLGLSEEPQGFFAAFSAYAALFHSAERNPEIADEPAIHPDRAGVDSLGDAMGAAEVLCPDARREAVFDVIGVIDHFFFAVESANC